MIYMIQYLRMKIDQSSLCLECGAVLEDQYSFYEYERYIHLHKL